MKNFIPILIIVFSVYAFGCKTSSKGFKKETAQLNLKDNDTVRIANDEVEYEIIIIEPGFNFWLDSQAKPRGYYSENYLESKNLLFVTAWNNRVLDPQRFDTKLYELQINYEQSVNYGYEVNYMLYNYFIYFQNKYKQRLTGARVPIN